LSVSFIQKFEEVVENAATEVESISGSILSVVNVVDPGLAPIVQALATLAKAIEDIDAKLLKMNPPVPAPSK